MLRTSLYASISDVLSGASSPDAPVPSTFSDEGATFVFITVVGDEFDGRVSSCSTFSIIFVAPTGPAIGGDWRSVPEVAAGEARLWDAFGVNPRALWPADDSASGDGKLTPSFDAPPFDAPPFGAPPFGAPPFDGLDMPTLAGGWPGRKRNFAPGDVFFAARRAVLDVFGVKILLTSAYV